MERETFSHPILYPFFYLVFFKIFTSRMAVAQVVPIRVGVVLDLDDYGEMTLNSMSMALSNFYATHDHYKTRLDLISRDSKGDVVGAAAAALELLSNVRVQAIIGPTYSVQASFPISLGHKAQVPVITFSATSPSLSSIPTPYFIRATLNDSSQVDAIGAIIQALGWREIVPIYEDNEFGQGIIPYLSDALENVNARIPYRSVISPLATDDQIVAELYKLMTMQTRVFVVHMLSPLASRLEAFGVSDAGPKLIQALLSTTFNGLAGNFQLVDGQLQAPPFQIINMVGPGAQGIGYWTKEKGIVKELNSTTVKTGFTDFVHVTWTSDNSPKVEGYCIDVFDAVIAALPYGVPYEYIPFATPDHKMAGTYNDLVYQVYLGNYDAVAGDVTIVANRSQYVDFTLPFIQSGVSMVVSIKDDKGKNAWVFLKPLTWELWVTSFCSFVFIGVLIWILEHRINEDFRGPLWHQVGMIFWFAFSTMVFAQKEKVISNLARFVLIIWFLVVLILTQSYTASLASMLTVQKLEPTVTDVSDLIRTKQIVGYKDRSFVYGVLQKMGFDDSRLLPFNSAEQMDELLSKGSGNGGVAAAFHEDPYIKLFLLKYGSKYTMVGPLQKADGLGFVFPIGSPLVPDVSRAILNVTEGQKIAKIDRKWLADYIKYPDSSALSSSPKNLGLSSFWGLFLIVGVVGVAALIIYVIKFLHENWSVIEHSSTVQGKIAELLQRFDNKDLSSHTFKDNKMAERDGGDGSGYEESTSMDSPRENHQCPSTLSPASPHTTGPPSPVFSSSTTEQTDQRDSADNSTRSQQGELSQMTNQEIQLVLPNETNRKHQHSHKG